MNQKLIFGLDIGTASIGWAVVNADENDDTVVLQDASVRIIPYNKSGKDGELAAFSAGNKISINAARTTMRSARKGYDRYKRRRAALMNTLIRFGWLPDTWRSADTRPTFISKDVLIPARGKATTETLTLYDAALVLLWLNTRRGFKSGRKGVVSADKDETEYKKNIAENVAALQGRTIGEKYFEDWTANPHAALRNTMYNRADYIAEFDAIWARQAEANPAEFTAERQKTLRDDIIYKQRPLRSQKGLVSFCSLESRKQTIVIDGKDKEVTRGLRCAPKSSPLFQIELIWEVINNIVITDTKEGTRIVFPFAEGETPAQPTTPNLFTTLDAQQKEAIDYDAAKTENAKRRMELFNYMNENAKASPLQVRAALGFKQKERYGMNYNSDLNGNKTYDTLKKGLAKAGIDRPDLLYYDLDKHPNDQPKQGLQNLWHALYSIEEIGALRATLVRQFDMTEAQATSLIDAVGFASDFGSKSTKALYKLMPHLRAGMKYSDAVAAAYEGRSHSNSETKAELAERAVLLALPMLKRNELRQPVVEKILNQVILVVNNLIAEYGTPDEIVVEMARELQQTIKQRKQTFENNKDTEKDKKSIIDKIKLEIPNIKTPTARDILKYRLWREFNFVSPYEPSKSISLSQLFAPGAYEIEHIIPRSRYFDDSFANKTIARTTVNADKLNDTGIDFMERFEGGKNQAAYHALIKSYYDRKMISPSKYNNLMMKGSEIGEKGFNARALNETRFIAKETLHRLKLVCPNGNVRPTNGKVTAHLRHIWGLDELIMDLRKGDFAAHNLLEHKTSPSGKTYEFIPNWDKRKDHRHHAVDAIVIALTSRAMVQKLSTLNARGINANMHDGKPRKAWHIDPPMSDLREQAAAVVDGIFVSFKGGKRAASHTKPKGKPNVKPTLTPRGALHEETVYGKIKHKKMHFAVAKLKPEHIALIDDPTHRDAVSARLAQYAGEAKLALKAMQKDLKKKPITLADGTALEAVQVWEEKYVVSKGVSKDFTAEFIENKVIDKGVQKALLAHLAEYGGDPKKAFGNLKAAPVWLNKAAGIMIKKVRIFSRLTDATLIPRGYVVLGNNHHLALYLDAEGQKHLEVVSFWEAVERVRQGGTPIITEHALYGRLLFSLSINETVVIGIDKETLRDAINRNDKKFIAKHLYRTQTISGRYNKIDSKFRSLWETELDDSTEAKEMKRYHHIQSVDGLNNCIKVNIDIIGRLTICD